MKFNVIMELLAVAAFFFVVWGVAMLCYAAFG